MSFVVPALSPCTVWKKLTCLCTHVFDNYRQFQADKQKSAIGQLLKQNAKESCLVLRHCVLLDACGCARDTLRGLCMRFGSDICLHPPAHLWIFCTLSIAAAQRKARNGAATSHNKDRNEAVRPSTNTYFAPSLHTSKQVCPGVVCFGVRQTTLLHFSTYACRKFNTLRMKLEEKRQQVQRLMVEKNAPTGRATASHSVSRPNSPQQPYAGATPSRGGFLRSRHVRC